MKSNLLRRPTLGAVLRFVVIFGLLIVPWRGWNEAYAHYFQALGQIAFNLPGETRRLVIFGPASGKKPGLDTSLTLVNPALLDSTGRGLVETTELDARAIGWVPTALTGALVLATPIPWPRRLGALIGGLVLIHLFILFTLQTWIWNNSADLSLLTLSHFWQRAVWELNYALMTQIGASFTVPVLIWVLVTFRRQDVLVN